MNDLKFISDKAGIDNLIIELQDLINRYSLDNHCNVNDYILTEYILGHLDSIAIMRRAMIIHQNLDKTKD